MSSKTLTPTMQRRLFLLMRYMQALSEGDLETIDKILSIAQRDDVLERMLIEINILDQPEEQGEAERQIIASLLTNQEVGSTGSHHAERFSTIADARRSAGKRRRWLFKRLNALAAILVVCVLLGGFLSFRAIYHQPQSTGSGTLSTPTITPTGSWHIVQSIKHNGILPPSTISIMAIAQDDAWAISGPSSASATTLEHWNGQRWQVVTLPGIQPSNLTGLAATSADDVWLVGSYINSNTAGKVAIFIAHWNGQRWELRNQGNLPASGELSAVTAIAPDNVWAVGDSIGATKENFSSLIIHWNGQQWSVVAHPMLESQGSNGPVGIEFTAITALSAQDIWAIGSVSTYQTNAYAANVIHPLAEHWNGQQWSAAQMPDSGGLFEQLNAITALSPDDIWAVGSTAKSMGAAGNENSQGLIEHWNGTHWSVVPGIQISKGLNLSGIVALSPTDVWAVGAGLAPAEQNAQTPPTPGYLEHWNGTQWSLVRSPAGTQYFSSAALIPGANEFWVGGAPDLIMYYKSK